MKVLGVDPGSHRTGWGVVAQAGSRLRLIDSGLITAPPSSLPERLKAIADGLGEVLEKHHPDAVAIEAVFHAKNSQSALKLGHARGVALLCVAQAGATLFEYSPSEIKRAATGSGRASKQEVLRMVQTLLGHTGALSLDTSDALAAAICHIHAAPAREILAAADARQHGRRE